MIQYFENHKKKKKTGNILFLYFFSPHSCFFYLECKTAYRFCCMWKNIAITAKGIGPQFIFTEGGTNMSPASFLPFILFLRKRCYFFHY